jgi:hypothetical protein
MRRIAALIGVLAAAVVAAPAQALPELRISMPSQRYDGQTAPVYVDAFQEPGKLLYRFEALIHNDGTTLDLYREADGSVHQALWPDGQPTAAQHPDERPSGVATAPAGPGARMEYVVEETHDHFHFFTAARYALEVPGAPARVSGKIGFCMFDSFDIPGGTADWFQPAEPWCHEEAPDTDPGFVRMGLSPGAADRYTSQREFQYVDITGLAPGAYRLRGVANPEGHVLEDDGEPAVTEEQRAIPGVTADPAAIATGAGAAAAVDVSARAVAPEVPAREAASCRPRATVDACYLRITAATPLSYAVASAPAHGSAWFDGARLTYTPAAGFSGADRLTYTATDARGLQSAPATVTIAVAPVPPVVGQVTIDPLPLMRRLLRIDGARRTGARRLAVRLHCRPAASGSCAGVLEARIAGRRAGRARFGGIPAGRTRTVRLRVSRPVARRLVRLRATVRDTLGPGRVARRATRPLG